MAALNPERVAQFLMDEFRQEETAGFPLLGRVPDTATKFFLKHFKTLSAGQQATRLHGAVKRAVSHFEPLACPSPALTAEEELACNDWLNASATQMMAGPDGWKFMSLKLLKMAASPRKKVSERQGERLLTDGALRAIDAIEAVKAADLRRLIKSAFATRLNLSARSNGGGNWTYRRENNSGLVEVKIDFGHSTGAQLDYEVNVTDAASGVRMKRGSIERFFGFGISWWDFITSENVSDTVALLTEIVDYLITLPSRLAVAALETASTCSS